MNSPQGCGWLKGIFGLLVLHCVLLASLVVIFYTHSPGRAPADPPRTTLFQRTINDAALEDRSRIVNTLFALNDANNHLHWQQQDGKRWVKVVAWMNRRSFSDHYEGKTRSSAPPEGTARLWVTLVPQVRDFCRTLNLPDPRFRLQQYLGLDPDRPYDLFVELWVQPQDVFRPCADPEPDDSGCQLQMNRDNPPKVKGIRDYPAWFHRLVSESYSNEGAPWTRLGYTYDWHYGTRGVGASEYLIAPTSEFLIAAAYTTDQYCQESPQVAGNQP